MINIVLWFAENIKFGKYKTVLNTIFDKIISIIRKKNETFILLYLYLSIKMW